MAVYVDIRCNKCDELRCDVWSSEEGKRHAKTAAGKRCGGMWERVYTLTPAPAPGAHASEKCVVYVSEKEGGKVQYPGRNDVPVPERLQRRGYERVEINPAQMGAFERKHGVTNERRHFNNGNGFHT